jgi:hypothetical protein
MIDTKDSCFSWPRLVDRWSPSPRQELVVRMALNGRAKNQGPDWDRRVRALMAELKINTTAKMAKLWREAD